MFSAIPFPLRYDQLARFADNLSVSLAAGVELRQAIRTSSGSLVKTVPAFREVWERVDQGEHLSEALRAVESQLPRFVLPVVESGECSGRLIESLRFLSTHLRMPGCCRWRS
jgi:type II secretory pathway component PulF